MSFSIEVKNLDKIREKFARSPKIVEPILKDGLVEAGKVIVRTEVKEAPHDTGNLQRSVQFRINNLVGIVEPLAEYAGSVEFGQPPHSVSPEAIMGWARRHGLNPYAVAHAIKKKGTRANPFVQRTAEQVGREINTIFAKALKEITAELAK